MNRNPQSLTQPSARLLLAVSAVALVISPLSPVLLLAQSDDTASAGTDVEKTANEAPTLTTSGQTSNQVFAAMQKTLDETESLSCSIQQTIMMSGQRFLATGTFVHATGNRMRLEYKLFPVRASKASDKAQQTVGSDPQDVSELKETGSLTQVSDGSLLWSYWVNATSKQLTRRNLQEIADAVGNLPNENNLQNLQSLGVGGLQALISQLQAGMEFGAAQQQTLGDKKLIVLSGRWNQKTRKDVLGLTDDRDAQLPDYLPDFVRVYVDADQMLPVRIQYLKKHPAADVKQVRPLVTLDFRSIKRNVQIPEGTFDFQRPDDKDLVEVDQTEQIIEGIKQLSTAEKADENADAAKDKP
jgi:outer membrane lipoprotein-sorting protein